MPKPLGPCGQFHTHRGGHGLWIILSIKLRRHGHTCGFTCFNRLFSTVVGDAHLGIEMLDPLLPIRVSTGLKNIHPPSKQQPHRHPPLHQPECGSTSTGMQRAA